MSIVVGESKTETIGLDRREFVRKLLELTPDALVVSALGSPSYDVFSSGHRDTNFYLWGAMGGAIPFALGLALAQSDRSVVVVTGDGEQLMSLGSLATVAVAGPLNLTIVVLDNGRFGETGMQHSHTSYKTDLAGVAQASGVSNVVRVTSVDQVREVAEHIVKRHGSTYVHVPIVDGELPRALPPRDSAAQRTAFRASLGLKTF